MRKFNRVEARVPRENICSITEMKCYRKEICKRCDRCVEYKGIIQGDKDANNSLHRDSN